MIMPNVLQGFGIEILLIAETSYLWFQSLKNRKTTTLSAFFNLCSALMLFLLINIPVRITDLNLVSWDPRLVFILNAVYIALETFTAYEWFVYFLTVEETDFALGIKNNMVITIPLLIMLVLLGLSYETHWLFYVDENGLYQRGSMFFLQLLIPYLYLAASCVSAVFVYKKNRNKRLFSIFFSAFFVNMAASVLQVFFSGSFNHAGLCFAVLLVYIEMYQYEIKQMEKMKSLGVVNKELEVVNNKLNETIKELETSVENERAANNAKNEFLSRMSHDIRTPLNGILGIIEIDERHPDDIKLLTENREKARIAAKHLLSLINDILDMSKLSSGKYEFSHEPFVVSQLLNEILTIANTNASNRGITLIYENENNSFDYPPTYGSPLHVTRALLNIIGNAIKYNKVGGSVSVRLDHEFSGNGRIKYTFRISDTGIGMSEDYINNLFEPFSQEHVDARSVYNGSGLGMAITKALIDQMGGTIDVDSRSGEGSTFTICMDFEIAQDNIKQDGMTEEYDNLNSINILLVEDNELNIEIAQTLLEECGAIVEVAENGKIALEKIIDAPAGKYDVILMDCMMPVMNGFEATASIRALDRSDTKNIPIIAMTANAFADDVRKCLDYGMNDHLSKPFDLGKVIGTIRKYVDPCIEQGM